MPQPTLALTMAPATVEGERATKASSQQQPPPHTKGEATTIVVPVSFYKEPEYSTSQLDKGKGILTIEPEPTTQLVPATSEVRRDPNEPVKVLYEINGTTYYITEDEIQAYLDKTKKIRNVAEEEQASRATLIEVVN